MKHPDLVVGLGTSDDAGVFALASGQMLVQSVDYFTPIVDDPSDWGRIAAANALSDIYAMGATPLTALQLLGWPRDAIPLDIAARVVEGGADIMAQAGCVVVGGHTIDLPEPVYGFAVTGIAERADLATNAGGQPGDRLVLTKPIGTGIVATAHKAGQCPPEVLATAIASMARLNDVAGSRLSVASAATDVTGFGLVGHLGEMLDASGTGAVVEAAAVPLFQGVADLHEGGFYPGGSRRNLAHSEGRVRGDRTLLPYLADAQTSGGLLVALPPDAVAGYIEAVPGAVEIGHLTEGSGEIELV